jgi:hypothetical protein
MQMTSLGLLFWVLLGLVVQVALFLGHGIWVKWRELTALKSGDAQPHLRQQRRPPLPLAPKRAHGKVSGRSRLFSSKQRMRLVQSVRSICSRWTVNRCLTTSLASF